jgi:hypothetical protein
LDFVFLELLDEMRDAAHASGFLRRRR